MALPGLPSLTSFTKISLNIRGSIKTYLLDILLTTSGYCYNLFLPLAPSPLFTSGLFLYELAKCKE